MAHLRFLYHPELTGRDGRVFTADEPDPTEPGWVDTPAKFDPNYVEPAAPEAVDGEQPAAVAGPPRVHVAYPSFRYSTQGLEPRQVSCVDEDRALDPAEWKHSPDPKTWAQVRSVAPAAAPAAASTPAAAAGPSEDEKKKQLHGMSAGDVVALISQSTNVDTLTDISRLEGLNPKGERVTVLKAVKARLAELAAPQE